MNVSSSDPWERHEPSVICVQVARQHIDLSWQLVRPPVNNTHHERPRLSQNEVLFRDARILEARQLDCQDAKPNVRVSWYSGSLGCLHACALV